MTPREIQEALLAEYLELVRGIRKNTPGTEDTFVVRVVAQLVSSAGPWHAGEKLARIRAVVAAAEQVRRERDGGAR